MRYKLMMHTLALAVLGGAFMPPALSQWLWIDQDGRKVFSDQAPPVSIPQKNILKQPGNRTAGSDAPVASRETGLAPGVRVAAPVQSSSGALKLSGKDPELESRKKQASDLEKTQKQAEAERLASVKADNCERARKGQASLLSGARISITNAKGEREFMDDAVRLSESRRLQAIADNDCINSLPLNRAVLP